MPTKKIRLVVLDIAGSPNESPQTLEIMLNSMKRALHEWFSLLTCSYFPETNRELISLVLTIGGNVEV